MDKQNEPAKKTTQKTTRKPRAKTKLPKEPLISGKELNAKGTHKLVKIHIDTILDMTIAGYTNREIIAHIKKEYGITIDDQALFYHRKKNIHRLCRSEEEQLQAAMARSSYMQLATRVASLERAIEREARKKNPSGYAVSMLMGQLETAIKNVEMIRLKREEIARKVGGNTGEVDHDEYIRDMDARSRKIKQAEIIETEIFEGGARDELIVLPRVNKIAPNPVPPMPPVSNNNDGPIIDLEDGDDGLSETDLFARG